MRIGIDCRFTVAARPRGTGRYVENLTRHLARIDKKNEYIFYVHRAQNLDRLPQQPNTKVRVIPLQIYPLWEQIFLPLYARVDRLNVLHSAGTTGPLFLSGSIGYVATIHDVSFLLPEQVMPKPKLAYQRIARLYRRLVVPRVARLAVRVITVSRYTCGEIVRITGISPSKTRVIYHGLTMDNITDVPKECVGIQDLPASYMLCLGGDAPHKNTERVVRVFISLASLGRTRGCELVILGVQKPHASPYWRPAMASSCARQIHFIDFIVDNSEFAGLYQRALFVLSASLNESFGFPALEAMSNGVPVITSNVGAIPEVVGQAAMLIDPYSDISMEQAILAMLNDASLRQQFIAQGYKRITSFSWHRAAEETLKVYREVAEG
jgi:glycosyltransferase involved in cell wall biosynthesis